MKNQLTLWVISGFLMFSSAFSLAEVSAEEYFDIDNKLLGAIQEILKQNKAEAKRVMLISESPDHVLVTVLDSISQCHVYSHQELIPCTEEQANKALLYNEEMEQKLPLVLRRITYSDREKTVSGTLLFLTGAVLFIALPAQPVIGTVGVAIMILGASYKRW